MPNLATSTNSVSDDVLERALAERLERYGVKVGLATKLGILVTALLGAAALVGALLDGDHQGDSRTALGGMVLTAITTIYGRMQQQAALNRDAPSPRQLVSDTSGDLDVGDMIAALPDTPSTHQVPSDASLQATYPGEPPVDPPTVPPGLRP